ncbi:MAG: L-lactate dehydrogenase [Vicingaceae bacterium]
MNRTNITVVGLGNVGAQVVNLLLAAKNNIAINVMEPNEQLTGRFLDLEHASFIHNIPLTINQEICFLNADIIIHTAGGNVALGEDRNSVTSKSINIAYQVFKNKKFTNNPFIIVVSNPVDVIAYTIYKLNITSPQKIISTGTWIDTLRLKYYLQQYHLSFDDNLMVLGEHGTDITVVYKEKKHRNFQKAIQDMLAAATTIKKTEGATKYTIANIACNLVQCLINNQNLKATLSVLLSNENAAFLNTLPLFLSVPVTIKNGEIHQLLLTEILNKNDTISLTRNAKKIYNLLHTNQLI